MGRFPFILARATPADLAVLLELAQDAREWLRGKNTDQWAKPWPDSGKRDERLLADLGDGKTWIVWDDATPAATITVSLDDPVDSADNPVWPDHTRAESALYVHRVIVRRSYAGLGLGAGLLDWASDVARRAIGTPLIRIDVWTNNWDLHAYYRRQRFALCEYRDPRHLPDYPSRALFERRVLMNGAADCPALFSERQPATP